MLDSIDTNWLGYLALALVIGGFSVGLGLMLNDPNAWFQQAWGRYVAKLEVEVRFLFYHTTGADIARKQLYTSLGLLILAFLFEDALFVVLIPLVAILPLSILHRNRDKRVDTIELQLDTWLLMLANALKATPSLGDAINSSARIMRGPIAQEIDLVIKEVNLGTPLDQAITNMGLRVNNRTLSGALATILIGRQTGGDLPRILEDSAATLREMQRLEGVVRTKTAEGKGQAYVLGAIPFVLIGALHAVDPEWLQPLFETTLGYVIIGISMSLWLGAILAARKILQVDV